jgi:hypothetical protein
MPFYCVEKEDEKQIIAVLWVQSPLLISRTGQAREAHVARSDAEALEVQAS